VRIDGELQCPVVDPEVEEADARDVVGVGQRLESSDSGVAGARVVAEPIDDPSELVPTAMRVVVEAGGVAIGVAEFGYANGVVKVRMHPG
jgi:hypothetical protein